MSSTFFAIAIAGGCSSSGGGGGAVPCPDGGSCPNNQVCVNGFCQSASGGNGGSAGSGVGGSAGSGFGGSAGSGFGGSAGSGVGGSAGSGFGGSAGSGFGGSAGSGFGGSAGSGFGGSAGSGFGGSAGSGFGGSAGSSATGGTGGTGVVNVTPICTVPATAPSGGTCYDGQGTCNPVTNLPCATGEACDLGQNGFECFGPPNDATCGSTCSNQTGPFCVGGYSCLGASLTQCARYCCTDADCGGTVGSCKEVTTGIKACGS